MNTTARILALAILSAFGCASGPPQADLPEGGTSGAGPAGLAGGADGAPGAGGMAEGGEPGMGGAAGESGAGGTLAAGGSGGAVCGSLADVATTACPGDVRKNGRACLRCASQTDGSKLVCDGADGVMVSCVADCGECAPSGAGGTSGTGGQGGTGGAGGAPDPLAPYDDGLCPTGGWLTYRIPKATCLTVYTTFSSDIIDIRKPNSCEMYQVFQGSTWDGNTTSSASFRKNIAPIMVCRYTKRIQTPSGSYVCDSDFITKQPIVCPGP